MESKKIKNINSETENIILTDETITKIVKNELFKAQVMNDHPNIMLYHWFLEHANDYGKLPCNILKFTFDEVFGNDSPMMLDKWHIDNTKRKKKKKHESEVAI